MSHQNLLSDVMLHNAAWMWGQEENTASVVKERDARNASEMLLQVY
jgi:hypothetical protein